MGLKELKDEIKTTLLTTDMQQHQTCKRVLFLDFLYFEVFGRYFHVGMR